jgi:N-acetylmuramoyl-L-alanine amidase/putative methionine-R-sulfoxide reductase with GAF domain
MSATPNNAGAGWNGSPPKTAPPGPASSGEGGQNALQALLAFACIRQQAERHKTQSSGTPSQKTSDEQFALDEVLQLVAQRAVSITGADGVAIALADNDAIVCRASSGHISPDAGIKLDPNSGFSGACLRSGETVRCDDSDSDARVNAQICRALGARSMIAVPLAAKQRVIGLVEAFSSEPRGFNESDERSLNLLGELILAAIRPEEEDRLAEIAKRVVSPETPSAQKLDQKPVIAVESAVAPSALPQPATTEPKPVAQAVTGAVAPAAPETPAIPAEAPAAPATLSPVSAPVRTTRIIVDEKFAPLRIGEAPEKVTAPGNDSTVAPVVAPELPKLVENDEARAPEAVLAIAKRTLADFIKERHRFAGVALIAALVLIVFGMGWAIFRAVRHGEQEISANTQRSIEIKTAEGETREIILPAPAVEKSVSSPLVTGLHNSSAGDSSAVVLDLQDQVQYEEHTLDNPARVYVDLHDTKIAPDVSKVKEIDDSLLKRVRMAQPTEGVSRVVLEMKDGAQFSGVRLDSNPYRLTIEVHKATTALLAKATPAALPKPSPSISVTPKKSPELRPTSAGEFQVVLDAGHGGWDLGTVGKKGLLEKDLVLDIVQRLGRLLENKMGAQVIYTRQDDAYIALEKRAEIANVAGADLFLSVHANYSDLSTARGVETYFTNTYSSIKARTAEDEALLKQVNWTNVDIRAKVTDSRKLAADVQQALCSSLVAMNPELRNRGVKEAQYVVLTGTQMPAALAEVSFVSSPEEEEHLQTSEYRQRIALALYRGVEKYRDETKSKNTKLASAKKLDAK